MTTEQRAAALWQILREEFGIETLEQFEEAYKNCPKIDITPFVPIHTNPPEKL